MIIKRLWGRALDALFGGKCEKGCGQRVFGSDVGWHQRDNHAGD